jgi:hypothetical protein
MHIKNAKFPRHSRSQRHVSPHSLSFQSTSTNQHRTDAAILSIPAPLLWKLKIPIYRKLVIAALLCSGLFVITAAIIRVVLTLGANASALNINRWGVRETIVGIVTINLPILKSLFNKSFWSPSSFKSSSFSHGTSRNVNGGSGTGPYELGSKVSARKLSSGHWDVEAEGSGGMGSRSEETLNVVGKMGNDSEERIFQRTHGITVQETYHVKSENLGPGDDWVKTANKVSIRAK